MKSRKPLLVEVAWTDARDLWETFKLDEVAAEVDLVDRVTSGYLAHADARKVIVAHDWDAPDEVSNFTAIPAGWIERITSPRAGVIFKRT